MRRQRRQKRVTYCTTVVQYLKAVRRTHGTLVSSSLPVKCSEDGPRPGPAHHIFKKSRPGPVRPIICSKFSARPGSAHHMATRPMKHGLHVSHPDNCVGRPVDLTGRPMARPRVRPVLKGACATLMCFFTLNCVNAVVFCVFFLVCIPWDSCFRPMRHT